MSEDPTNARYGIPVSPDLASKLKALDLSPACKGYILLVDDESVIRTVISSLLEDLGYQVVTAENGGAAIKTLRLKQGSIDLILLDLMMPEMSGNECFYRLQEIAPDIPIVIASGLVADDGFEQLERDGAAGHLNKPYSVGELCLLLEQFINK